MAQWHTQASFPTNCASEFAAAPTLAVLTFMLHMFMFLKASNYLLYKGATQKQRIANTRKNRQHSKPESTRKNKDRAYRNTNNKTKEITNT